MKCGVSLSDWKLTRLVAAQVEAELSRRKLGLEESIQESRTLAPEPPVRVLCGGAVRIGEVIQMQRQGADMQRALHTGPNLPHRRIARRAHQHSLKL